ncbi:hypothetical protein [Flectobacillus roseus]|uniref:hypothetical protein n=1 Tax=Flectobacillus roseus TaxID=502259 RepID=UPI0024B7446E|nr:hypothetical protein [Flectobacillus roseus]MDI9872037.1 hypothetical protein [Flectobacillus roseus]
MRNLFTNKLHYDKLFVMALISTICIIFCQASLFAQTGPNDDFDGDGIVNNLDADDDNDGIPDILESPLCYVSKEAMSSFFRVGVIQLSSDITRVTGNTELNNLIDGGGSYIVFTSSASIVDKTIMGFNFGNPLKIDTLTIKTNTTTNFVSGTYKVQGSNDGVNWTDLTGLT